MKKFLCLLLIPLFSLIFIYGCGEDKTSKDLQVLYESMVSSIKIDNDNKFFSSADKPNSLNIEYTEDITNAIDNVTPTTDIQKRYVAIRYQQNVLDYIYNYYENNHKDFYTVMSTAEYPNTEMNDLYATLESLKTRLNTFKLSYSAFVDATTNGISDVMEFNLTNYSYELNQVIDQSFTFMYKFAYMYEKYGIEDYSKKNAQVLQTRVDKTYLDIAHIGYLENFKAFDYSVGHKGICDLLPIVETDNKFNLIDDLSNIKSLSSHIISNLKETDTDYVEVNDLLNNYLYAEDVFAQRVKNYTDIYNEQDIYTISQYKFSLISGVTYDSYLDSLSNSERASLIMLDQFVDNTYNKLIEKLTLIVE